MMRAGLTFDNLGGEKMAYHGDWPKEDRKRFVELWEKSGKDRDKFRELLMADEGFKKKGWGACEKKAVRIGFFDKAKLSKRFLFSGLKPEVLEEMKKMLADDNITWQEMEQHFPGIKEGQFRNKAKEWGIKINKEKPGRKPAQPETVQVTEAAETLTLEPQLIENREAGNITVEKFLLGLEALGPVKSDLWRYWGIIIGQLKEKRTIRATDLLLFAVELGAEGAKELLGGKVKKGKKKLRERILSYLRGVLGKFVEWGALSRFTVGRPGRETHDEYICKLAGFYTREELKQLIPDSEKARIFSGLVGAYEPGILPELLPESTRDLILDLLLGGPKKLEILTEELKGAIGHDLLVEFLEYCVEKKVVEEKPKGTFKLSAIAQVLGIEGMETQALLNRQFLEKFRGQKGPTTLHEARVAQDEEIEQKRIKLINLAADPETNDLPWVLFWGEAHIGALLTSLGFQERALDCIGKDLPEDLKPVHVLTSGTTFGEHKWILNALRRAEQESLSRYPWQLAVAMDLIRRLKELRKNDSGKVVERLGDKDVYMATQFAHTVLKAMRAARFYGVEPATLTLEERRNFYTRDYDQHMKLQYTIIQIYQRLTNGRTLLNEREVAEKIGRSVSEVRLIIEAMAYLEKGEPVPEEHQRVIDMDALDKTLHPEKQFDTSYIVTPDNIHVQCGEVDIRLFHDMGHTPLPQRPDPFIHLDKRVRGLQALGANPPHIVVCVHPQRLVGQYFPSRRHEHKHGTLGVTLPSLKNLQLLAEGELQGFYEGIREDESWRQLTVRREITQPGLVMVRGGKDNCYNLMLIDNRVLEEIEKNRDKPEERKIIVHVADTHWGGMPMTPELVIRFMSLGLYEMGGHVLWLNGDWLHGRNYPQSFHESAGTTLISMDKQNMFGTEVILKPFLRQGVSPNLIEVTGHDGNHCYNTLGVPLTGWAGLRSAIQAAGDIFEAQGRDATSWFSGTVRIDGDTFKWPYYENWYCGYKLAMTHNIFPKGKDPQFYTINFLEGLADFISDLYLLACGDRHHLKFVKFHNAYGFWFGRMCMQSGYEWFRGMKGEWMPGIIDLSNKRPPIIHLVSRDFLEKYRCKDPFFGPLEEKDELTVYASDGTPWVYDSVPFCYSKYINDWIKRLHSSKPPSRRAE